MHVHAGLHNVPEYMWCYYVRTVYSTHASPASQPGVRHARCSGRLACALASRLTYPHPGHVDDVMIKAPNGAELQLSELAVISLKEGVTRIRRENGNRTINVWASVDAEQVEPFKVANDIRDNFIPELLRKFPKVQSEVSGSIQEEMESADSQKRDFAISLLIVFSLLAIPLKSYSQAAMIMVVIPFGIIGSVFGHFLLGMDLSALSVMGILAASGVVVNDSLVMVDYVNNARKSGVKLKDAVVHAGTKRFRAIMLTSITTFIGLVPIIFFEVSAQAQIVIPMAISLAFGVLFATIVTLVLIPSLYLIIEDMKSVFKRKKKPSLTESSADLTIS